MDRELLLVTDHFTDELFIPALESIGGRGVVYGISRFIVDPERFEDDKEEPNAEMGRGVVYVKTLEGKPLRYITPDNRESLLKNFYRPYHNAINNQVKKAMRRFGSCLFLDCHSFPSKPLVIEADYRRNKERPDICIGTDEFHSSESLMSKISAHFEGNGLKVEINYPYSGTLVPSLYYKKDRRLSAVMIEINRKLYMNENTGERNEGFGRTKELIRNLLNILCNGI